MGKVIIVHASGITRVGFADHDWVLNAVFRAIYRGLLLWGVGARRRWRPRRRRWPRIYVVAINIIYVAIRIGRTKGASLIIHAGHVTIRITDQYRRRRNRRSPAGCVRR